MRRLGLAAVPLSLILAGCGSTQQSTHATDTSASSSPSRSAHPSASPSPARSAHPSKRTDTGRASGAFVDWSTYHRTPARTGQVASAPAGPLRVAWRKGPGSAVYGEPLVVDGSLIAATEGNRVVSLDPATGRQRWSVGLGAPQPPNGLPCGDIDPLGITGTPAYDAATGSVFVVAETAGGHHTLWAIDAANGHRRWHRSLDVLPNRNRSAEQQRAAILVAGDRVVVSFGALAGDCNNYVGYITSTSTSGEGTIHHYAVPTVRGGGMWSPAGPALSRTGSVYVVSANGAAQGKGWDRSNSVLELSAEKLRVISAFAPGTWRHDSLDDQGLGSTSPVPVRGLHRLVVGSKRSRLYLLPEHFSGIGSGIATLDGCSTFGGAAVAGRTVIEPCLFENQIRAVRVGTSSLRWRWIARGIYGSPIVAGARVYVTDRASGDLVVMRLADGKVVQRIHAGPVSHFPSEVVDGGFVFVPTLSGVTAFRG